MEVEGTEYCFGGSSNDALGVVAMSPLHQTRKELLQQLTTQDQGEQWAGMIRHRYVDAQPLTCHRT